MLIHHYVQNQPLPHHAGLSNLNLLSRRGLRATAFASSPIGWMPDSGSDSRGWMGLHNGHNGDTKIGLRIKKIDSDAPHLLAIKQGRQTILKTSNLRNRDLQKARQARRRSMKVSR